MLGTRNVLEIVRSHLVGVSRGRDKAVGPFMSKSIPKLLGANQYIATVYSHDRTIWPGMYAPKVYATPKPWRLLCNPGKTVCIISLACRNCTNILGWEDQCSLWYQDQAWRFVQGAAWVNVTGTWVRSVPLHGGCSLFASQSGKNNPKPRNLPYTGYGLIQLAEGHAWRRSLCLGQEIKGYEWLGPNSIYNNGTCESPAEHRLLCGQGENQHECHWYEVTGSIIITAVIRGVVKTVGAVLNGAKALGNWILAQIWSLFKCVWPALVIFLCVLFGVLTFFILCKASAMAAFQRLFGVSPSTDRRPLIKEERDNK